MWRQWAWLGAQLYYARKTQILRGFRRIVQAELPQAHQMSQSARTDLTHGLSASQGQQCPTLLLSDSYGLKQFEIERCLRRKGDVAIAGQARTTSTSGGAFAATCNGTDGGTTSGATAHHDCGALAFSFAGHGCTRGLNLVILAINCDAGELERQRGAALEPAGSFRVSHDSLRARTLRNGNFSFDFNGRFDRRRKLVAGFVGLRANGLIQNDGNHGVSRHD